MRRLIRRSKTWQSNLDLTRRIEELEREMLTTANFMYELADSPLVRPDVRDFLVSYYDRLQDVFNNRDVERNCYGEVIGYSNSYTLSRQARREQTIGEFAATIEE